MVAEPDTFDEDLLWIADKLVSRTGGAFGFIMRRSANAEPEILANVKTPRELAARIAINIGDDLAWRPASGNRLDSAGVHQAALPVEVDGALSVRALALRFRPTERATILAVVCRPDGERPFTTIEEHVATVLFPVLARYIRLWWLHRTERRLVRALHTAVDFTGNGLILMNRGGELLFANDKATSLLDDKDGLRRSGDSVSAWRDEDGLRLHAAIRHAVHCNLLGGQDGDLPRAAIVALERRVGGRKLLVAVVAARGPAIDPYDPAVIVYILDPQPDIGKLLGPVCTLYKLSASETRLVHQLASGLSVNEAAAKMRVQLHTARTYLKQVFAKTSTHRQSDLMRVIFLSLLHTRSAADLAFLSNSVPSNGDRDHA